MRLAPANYRPPSIGPDDPTWCRCGLHRARVKGGLCPVCVDENTKENR